VTCAALTVIGGCGFVATMVRAARWTGAAPTGAAWGRIVPWLAVAVLLTGLVALIVGLALIPRSLGFSPSGAGRVWFSIRGSLWLDIGTFAIACSTVTLLIRARRRGRADSVRR
jgi:membrane protein implicated in regulation of membrane protease activity